MRFKRKIELGCVFDSVKKLPADVVRQNITNAGGPEASRYLLDLCAPLSSWALPIKNKTNPGKSRTQLKLARPEKQYMCSINERILQVQTDNWDAARILFFYRDNNCMHLFQKNWRTGNSNDGCLCYPIK